MLRDGSYTTEPYIFTENTVHYRTQLLKYRTLVIILIEIIGHCWVFCCWKRIFYPQICITKQQKYLWTFQCRENFGRGSNLFTKYRPGTPGRDQRCNNLENCFFLKWGFFYFFLFSSRFHFFTYNENVKAGSIIMR